LYHIINPADWAMKIVLVMWFSRTFIFIFKECPWKFKNRLLTKCFGANYLAIVHCNCIAFTFLYLLLVFFDIIIRSMNVYTYMALFARTNSVQSDQARYSLLLNIISLKLYHSLMHFFENKHINLCWNKEYPLFFSCIL
jgi:hypothetical protein